MSDPPAGLRFFCAGRTTPSRTSGVSVSATSTRAKDHRYQAMKTDPHAKNQNNRCGFRRKPYIPSVCYTLLITTRTFITPLNPSIPPENRLWELPTNRNRTPGSRERDRRGFHHRIRRRTPPIPHPPPTISTPPKDEKMHQPILKSTQSIQSMDGCPLPLDMDT